MIDYRNPYTPVASVMPKYLAGRDNILETASSQIKALTAGYPSRSIALYGLRGIGKTVLLNAIESIANNKGVLVHHIEIEEKGSLLVPLASRCRSLSNKRLDEQFFSRHYNRCAQKQKQFLSAMAHCSELPCTLADVADYMGRKVPSIMPLRNRLIGEGMIYRVGGDLVDFTVPQFDRYLKRTNSID